MPTALDPIIENLLAKDQRYRSAEELLSDLEAIPASGSSSAARPAAFSIPPTSPPPAPIPATEAARSRPRTRMIASRHGLR
jgi:hypothetical protein